MGPENQETAVRGASSGWRVQAPRPAHRLGTYTRTTKLHAHASTHTYMLLHARPCGACA